MLLLYIVLGIDDFDRFLTLLPIWDFKCLRLLQAASGCRRALWASNALYVRDFWPEPPYRLYEINSKMYGKPRKTAEKGKVSGWVSSPQWANLTTRSVDFSRFPANARSPFPTFPHPAQAKDLCSCPQPASLTQEATNSIRPLHVTLRYAFKRASPE